MSVSANSKKKLVFAIAKFLKEEMKTMRQEDESLEVAIQCLENAFEISLEDSALDVGVSLPEIFNAATVQVRPDITDEVKAEAESWKNKGNELIKSEKFLEALDCYNKAIALNPTNPVYFCNRAAAYSRLNNHQATITDCMTAIEIEPTYSKAYGRLGLAYTSLNKFEEAKTAYLKALELEPDNTTYKNNFDLNEEKLRTVRNNPGGGLAGVNMDELTSMLGNQRVMNMASQLLSDPSMQSMLNNLIGANVPPGSGGMDGLLQAGQRLAQMMQSSNPELVEQLRQQVSRGGPTDPQQPPPSN